MARTSRSALVLTCLAVGMLAPALARAGKLDGVRSEVRGGSSSSKSSRGGSSSGSSSSSSSSNNRSSSSYSSGYSDPSPGYYGGGGGASSRRVYHHSHSTVVYTPRVRPRPRMLRHPYESRYDGYNIVSEEPDAPGREFAANLAAEGAWLGDGLVRGAIEGRLAFPRVEIDSRTSFYVEAPNGQPKDAMYLGDAGLFLVPLRATHWTLRAGGGVRYMVDGRTPGQGKREYALGWNVGMGFDFFPVRPLVVTYRLDLGRLWQATIVQNRATVGAALGPIELYAGYDALKIGAVWLHGPLVGLRGWF